MRFARPRWTSSLAAQLLGSHLVLLGLLGGLLVAAPLLLMRFDAQGFAEHVLDEEMRLIQRGLRFDAAGQPLRIDLPDESRWLYATLTDDLKYRLLNGSGEPVLSSQPGGRALVLPGRAFDPQLGLFDLKPVAAALPQLTVRTVAISQAGQSWYLQVAASERAAKLTRVGIGLVFVRLAVAPLVMTLLVVTAAVVFTLRRLLKPLREASDAAARIAPRTLGARLETRRLPTELRPLIDAFNQALQRLETGFKVQQEFLATAAHELKTPLALIRGQLEMDELGPREKAMLLQDVDRMSRQVQQLLHLAEVSESRNFIFAPVGVADVVTEAVDYLSRLASRKQVQLQVGADPAVAPLQADSGALFILLKNLLENAIQHCPAGGLVRVAVDTTGLRIGNEGDPIDEAHLPQLFQRFWRGPTRQDEGAGLGLAICLEIAEAHAWTLTARNTSAGVEFGVEFHLRP